MTRFTWGIVIGVLGLVAVALGLAFLSPGRDVAPDLSTPEGVTLAYAIALQRGDLDQAWGLLAQSTQAQTTKDRFITRAEGIRGSYQRARLNVQDVRIEGDTARVDVVRSVPSSGGLFGLGSDSFSTTNTVRLIREGGQWRITTPPDPFLLERTP